MTDSQSDGGKVQAAISQWEHAVRTTPDFVDTHYNLGSRVDLT